MGGLPNLFLAPVCLSLVRILTTALLPSQAPELKTVRAVARLRLSTRLCVTPVTLKKLVDLKNTARFTEPVITTLNLSSSASICHPVVANSRLQLLRSAVC